MANELQETLDELGAHLRGEKGKTNGQAVQGLARQASSLLDQRFNEERAELTKA